MNDKRQLLRHMVATLAYRGGKAVANAPEGFSSFRIREGSRTPEQILAHIGDLLEWALSIASGKQSWHDSKPLSWNDEVARFFATLEAFDSYLASDNLLNAPEEKLFQGPIADGFTDVGQNAVFETRAGKAIRWRALLARDFEIARRGSRAISRDAWDVGPTSSQRRSVTGRYD